LAREFGFRDSLCGRIAVELQAMEGFAPIRESAMLTHLRLPASQLGLRINFNVPVLKDGNRQFVWHYQEEGNARTLTAGEVRRERNAAPGTATDFKANAESASNG
jgi:hypothetical protein